MEEFNCRYGKSITRITRNNAPVIGQTIDIQSDNAITRFFSLKLSLNVYKRNTHICTG